jgi:alkylation response protein AidB-like acyl-CoA dehydrogenase
MDGDEPSSQQIVVAVPTDLPGVRAEAPARLVGLSASHTGQFTLENVELEDRWLIAGPVENVLSHGVGAGTGGLQTSTLAIGLARAAIELLAAESARRPDLRAAHDALDEEHARLADDLLALVRGESRCTKESVRQRANTFVLRATQAALSAAKGTGYVAGHPAGRWCREALFFLVWSCPQPVAAANLCELAGITD